MLKKVQLTGGPAVTICPLPAADRGGTWATDDTIIIGVSGSGLFEVSADDGELRPFLSLEAGELDRRFPALLPGGHAVLFATISSPVSQVAVQSIPDGERRVLAQGTRPSYLPSGHLVFGRGSALWAAPFDVEGLDCPVP